MSKSRTNLLPFTTIEQWVEGFVSSFGKGKLKDVLEQARFARHDHEIIFSNSGRVLPGLKVVVTCRTWEEYKILSDKTQQLRYRIKKLDPEVLHLVLLSPDKTVDEAMIILIDIATGEEFLSDNKNQGGNK